MAFRFRRSINLGGFRINLSKSGIGYSFGVKGLRYTHKAGGGSRSTFSIPHTGISYVKDHSAHKTARASTAEREVRPAPVEEEIEDELIESSSNEMIDRLNRADKLNRIFFVCRIVFPFLGICLLSMLFAIVSNGMQLTFDTGESIDGTAIAIVCGILGAASIGVSIFFLLQKVKIDLFYDFSEDVHYEREYSAFMKAFSSFQTTAKIWELRDDVPRERTEAAFGPLAKYINTDLDIKEMKLLRKEFLFLPDIIAVKQENGWAGVPYEEVIFSVCDAPTDETTVPEDATVVSEHWLHARKDGERNMQYKDENNYLIYNCLYGELTLSSERGLHVRLLCSSNEKAQTFCAALAKYIAFVKE